MYEQIDIILIRNAGSSAKKCGGVSPIYSDNKKTKSVYRMCLFFECVVINGGVKGVSLSANSMWQ